jgi:serine/threonine-protein kinase RsbW
VTEIAARLLIRSELAELERLLAFIGTFCKRCGVADELKYKLFLVIEELVVNAISHGYGGRSNGPIEIGLTHKARSIEVEVEDEAPAFDPLADRDPPDLDAPLDERGIGGLGIHFIRTLSDEADYRFERGRNIVRAVFAEPDDRS